MSRTNEEPLEVLKVRALETAERVREVEAVVAEARRIADVAASELQRARDQLQVCESALGAVRAAHDAAPTPKAAQAENDSNLAVARAQREVERTEKRAAEAAESLQGAIRALDVARLEQRKAELRVAAAPETISREIAPHWRALLEAHAALTSAASAIKAKLDSSHAASSSLRELGEHVPNIDNVHAILPALQSAAVKGGFVEPWNWHPVRRTALTASALVTMIDSIQVKPEGQVEWFKKKLEYIAATRTDHEASALESAEVAKAQRARDESPEGREAARKMAEHTARTSQPRFRGYSE